MATASSAVPRAGIRPRPGTARATHRNPPPVPVATAASAAAGIALYTAFPGIDAWWAAPVGVALLATAVHRRRARTGAWLGLLAGVMWFVPLLHWTALDARVGWWPWLLLALSQAAFVASLGAAAAWCGDLVDRRWWLWPPLTGVLWVAVEALRSRLPFGGFPWGRLAFSQADSPLVWLAAVGGAPLVTFGVAITGGLLAGVFWLIWQARPGLVPPAGAGRRRALTWAGTALLVPLSGLVVPYIPPGGEPVTVAIVQGNVPRLGLDFNAQRRAVLDNHVHATLDLASQVARGRVDQPDLVIWPENASDIDPFSNLDAYQRIQQAADAIGAPILVGALLRGPGESVRNAGLVWLPDRGPVDRYVKQHPVPFAEYLPLRPLVRAITAKADMVGNFIAGDRPGVLRAGPVVLGDVICFEVAYDNLVRDTVTRGAQLVVVQTNNATFNLTEARQQLAMVRLRAVEHARPALMASTVGVSAFVAADGTVADASGFNTRYVAVRRLRLGDGRTLATRLGMLPELLLSLAALAALVAGLTVHRAGRGLGTRAGTPRPDAGSRHRQPGTGTAGSRQGGGNVIEQSGAADGAEPTSYPGLGRVLVVVPTYNEADNIRQITRRLRQAVPNVDLLIADDASPDGTGQIADELADTDHQIKVLHREGKQGLGAAYVAGFQWSGQHGYDVVIEMDADGSHAPEELPRLLSALRDADVVIGSRWVSGGKVVNWPWHRLLLSRGANLYTRMALGMPVRDATAGYRAYRMAVLDKLDLDAVVSAGYCFQVDLTWRAYQEGFRVREVPITFTERELGHSKMSLSIVREALWRVSVWGVRSRWDGLRRRMSAR